MEGMQQWGDVGDLGETENKSYRFILDQLQGSGGMQERVAVAQSGNDKGLNSHLRGILG